MSSLWCPRCESWTASPDPEKRAEAYCSVAGCGWEGSFADAKSPGQRMDDLRAQLAERDAQCAAMRQHLEHYSFEHDGECPAVCGNGKCDCGAGENNEARKQVLASDAGTALLNELSAWRQLAEAAQQYINAPQDSLRHLMEDARTKLAAFGR